MNAVIFARRFRRAGSADKFFFVAAAAVSRDGRLGRSLLLACCRFFHRTLKNKFLLKRIFLVATKYDTYRGSEKADHKVDNSNSGCGTASGSRGDREEEPGDQTVSLNPQAGERPGNREGDLTGCACRRRRG